MEYTVELKRVARIGFGFSIIGGIDTHIPPMVCALVKNSPALHSRQISVGDVLCKVNGINVLNLETKQVVDLIRQCKDKITLSLKEDRLAKLKARPFLAEDGLIDPPSAAISGINPVSEDQANFQRTVGSSKNYEYGTDGKFTSTSALSNENTNQNYDMKFLHQKDKVHTTQYGNDSYKKKQNKSRQYYNSDLEDTHLNPAEAIYPNHIEPKKSPIITKAHVYDLDNLPRSPREFLTYKNTVSHSPVTHSNSEYSRTDNTYRRSSDSYRDTSSSYHESSTSNNRRTERANSHREPLYGDSYDRDYTYYREDRASTFSESHLKDIELDLDNLPPPDPELLDDLPPTSAPPYMDGNARFEYNDGHAFDDQAIEYNSPARPLSNPDIEHRPLMKSISLNKADKNIMVMSSNSPYQNNYSSPNVFEESERLYSFSERKNLTLTPNSLSVQILDQNDDFAQSSFKDKSALRPLSNNNSISKSTKTSLQNGTVNSELLPRELLNRHSQSSSSSVGTDNNDASSPADIASRLFTLNGYEDKDVAPMLGKNSEFSQKICREYLRFFDFKGLALDEALRVFLRKFSLTGETQERERILIHFSKRYHECNPNIDMSEDSVHTLICSLMLLNTDLHGHSISTKMTLNDFITNLSGLSDDGKDFPKELLKMLYNSIKTNEIVFSSAKPDFQNSPKTQKKRASNIHSNPFLELKAHSDDALVCKGLLYRKSVMDPGGRRTPAMRRNWRPFYCVLRGLVLINYKPDQMTSSVEPFTIGIHHSLAGYAKDYKKRAYVFKLITADWSVYYLQVKNQDEVRLWMDSLNVSAALLSAPPLPAPVGSSLKFQRPVMPVSKTKLPLAKQIEHHQEKITNIEADLADHIQYTPEPQSKNYLDWENKLDYLEFELKRFKAYHSVLTVPRLEEIRDKIIKYVATPSTPNTLPKPKSADVSRLQNLASNSSL